MPGNVTAVKIRYSGGERLITNAGDLNKLRTEWQNAPGTDVQFVTVYYDQTYQTDTQDGWDEKGNRINPRVVTENYVDQYHGLKYETPGAGEYYWFDPTTRTFGTGPQSQVPPGATGKYVKRGSAMPDSVWWNLYNMAKEDRKVP